MGRAAYRSKNSAKHLPTAGKSNRIEPSRFETRPDLKDFTFSPGGPKTWFAIIRRTVGQALA